MTGEMTQLDRFVAAFPSRDSMASAYADYLKEYGVGWETWPALNLAIIDRWSESGLLYIKKLAWKLYDFDMNFVPSCDTEGS